MMLFSRKFYLEANLKVVDVVAMYFNDFTKDNKNSEKW